MFLIAFAVLLLMYVLWQGQNRPMLRRGDWRTGAGLLAIGSFMASAFLAVKADWPEAAAMLAIACFLLLGARSERKVEPIAQPRPRRRERMDLADARSMLGVEEGATVEEIRIAYARLMRQAHPDHGGSDGLAAQLNAARDRLLGKNL
jgi:hypothetical protein